MNLPNVLTITRIALIPVFAWLMISGRIHEAFIVFAIGAFTDFLDGFIARKFDMITPLGQVLDPAADKLFILTSYTSAYMANLLPIYLLLAAWLKEIIVLSGYSVLCHILSKKIEIKPNMIGKCSTLFQMLTLLAIMVAGIGFTIADIWLYAFFGTTMFFIVASTTVYVITGMRLYSEKKAYGN